MSPSPRTARSARTALAAALLAALALVGCSAPAPVPTSTPTASETADAGASGEPSAPPTTEPPSIDAAERAAIVAGVESGDPAAIGPFMDDPVTYILASSECCGELSAADATGELLAYTGSSSGWSAPLDEAYLDEVRKSPYYADYVPDDVISMMASSDQLVVILGVTGDRITSVLVGHAEVLLFE